VNASSTKPWNGATESRDPGRSLEPPDGASTPRVAFAAAARSATGLRPDNQDSGLTAATLLAVADGVGGHVGGATASALAVRSLADARSEADGDPRILVGQLAAEANGRLSDICAELPVLSGMATTLTAVALSGDGRLGIAHIGDSRAYLLRGVQLVSLTYDHSVVQSLVDAGSLTAEQARSHPWRAVLLAALHGREDDLAAVEITAFRALPGDRLLLCSDGLWGVLPRQSIRRCLVVAGDVKSAADGLLDAALAAPAPDNVTVVVADVTEQGAAVAPAVVGAAAGSDRPPGGDRS